MFCFHYTEKLIDLQGLIVKNIIQDQFPPKCLANLINTLAAIPLPIKFMIIENNVSKISLHSVNSLISLFKNAAQIIDRYHFIRQIIWDFDNVCKRIQKIYGKQYKLLFKHSKQLLIKRGTKLKDYEKERINSMIYISDKLRSAYYRKEAFYSEQSRCQTTNGKMDFFGTKQ